MIKIIVSLAAAGSIAAGGTPSAVSGDVSVTRSCYPPRDDLSYVTRVTVNDSVAVDLWCGDRIVVRDRRCFVVRGSEATMVPCTDEDQVLTVPTGR